MIELKKLTKIYKTDAETVNALNSIDLDISSGQFLSIMGQSGSGKTTLMNILGCLDNPSSGKYLINGLDVSSGLYVYTLHGNDVSLSGKMMLMKYKPLM